MKQRRKEREREREREREQMADGREKKKRKKKERQNLRSLCVCERCCGVWRTRDDASSNQSVLCAFYVSTYVLSHLFFKKTTRHVYTDR